MADIDISILSGFVIMKKFKLWMTFSDMTNHVVLSMATAGLTTLNRASKMDFQIMLHSVALQAGSTAQGRAGYQARYATAYGMAIAIALGGIGDHRHTVALLELGGEFWSSGNMNVPEYFNLFLHQVQ